MLVGRRWQILALVGLCIQMAACSEAFAPWSGPAASLDIVAGDAQPPLEVGTKIPQSLSIKVVDAHDRSVSGITVMWTASSGTLTHSTSVTGRDGLASVEWTLGTESGTQTLTAAVNGLEPVTFTARALPGPASQIVLSRDTVRLLGTGDAFRLSARAADKFGNTAPGGVVIESSDTTIVAVESFGGGAVLVARRPDGIAQLHASAGNLTKTITVIVLPLPCQAAARVLDLAVGQVVTLSGTDASEFCVSGTGTGAEFTAIPFYSDQSGLFLRLSMYSGRTTTIPPLNLRASIRTSSERAQTKDFPQPDPNFESRLRGLSEKELTPRMNSARAARQNNRRLNLMAVPEVGDVIQLNTNSASGCANAVIRTARVAAITDRAIVAADTSNPQNGFTDADYQRFGETFDTLVYRVDTENFGEPSDIDGNDRVVLFFTRAVNELTPPNQNFFVGGFFFNRDLFPKTGTGQVEGCAGSNVAEMFYLLVPDPSGVVNQNTRSADFVRGVTVGVLAHEFQHLINASRHLYVTNSHSFEDVFLDEGLAHMAEELVFYRASGLAPRQNVSFEATRSSAAVLDAFNQFGAPNMRRFREYLLNPLVNSPYADNADLATRGATWAFLRYAADRKGGAENALWFDLANPPIGVHGMQNLERVFGPAIQTWIRDWATADYADDLVAGIEPEDNNPSWNFRSVIAGMNDNVFGLPTQKLDSANVTSLSIRDGGAAYIRFGVASGAVGGGRITSRAGPVPASLSVSIIRTK